MADHTLGPWKVDSEDSLVIFGPDDIYVAETGHPHRELAVDEANARLIAAAPELLELAREGLEASDDFYDARYRITDRLKAAIAKATGKG